MRSLLYRVAARARLLLPSAAFFAAVLAETAGRRW
jgi:hypothetical protein